MSTQFTLPQLLTHTGRSYECIDVRTIAADINGVMYNVVTSIHFSMSSQTATEEEIRSHFVGHVLEDGPLQFGWACLPVNEWVSLAAQLKAGEVCVGRVVASLGTGVELESFSSTIASGSSGYINSRTSYPMFQAIKATLPGGASTELGRSLDSIGYRPDVMKQLSRSGFHSFRELARNFVGAADPCGPSLVAILAPVPVMADRIEVSPVEHRIRIHVRLHPTLSTKLQLKGDLLGQPWGGYNKKLVFGKLEMNESEQAYADAVFDSPSPADFIEVRVVHGDLGIVHAPRFSVRQALPAVYLNPMFEILKRFCPEAELKLMFTEPRYGDGDRRKDEDRPQRRFETYMQWFLSCFGFAAVQLGTKEHLYEADGEPGRKMRLGSLDLLAFHRQRNLLLLGSCTTNPPQAGDITNLINLKAALAKDLQQDAGFDVALAIFTTADRCFPITQGADFIAVFDKPRVSALMDALSSGEEESFFSSLRGGFEQGGDLLSTPEHGDLS